MRGHRLWLGNSHWALGKKRSSGALNQLSCDLKDQEKVTRSGLTKEVGKSPTLTFQIWLDKDTGNVIYNATSRRRLDKTSLH